MTHVTRAARGLAMMMAAVLGLVGFAHPSQASAATAHDDVVAELRARATTAQAVASAAGGHTMRFVSEADRQERVCIAVDTVANMAAIQRIASPGCGVAMVLFTGTTSYSRFSNQGAFGPGLRPDPAALRLLGRPGARWVTLPNHGRSPATEFTNEFAINAMIDSALLSVEVITAAEVTPAQITITGHPRRLPARTSTQRYVFAGDQLTEVVTTGRDASRVTFDYTRPSLSVPHARRVVPLKRYTQAAAVTGAVRQARQAAPALRRSVIRRAHRVTPVTALRRAVHNWGNEVGALPTFNRSRPIPGGVVVTASNRFGRVAIALTWRPTTKTVRVDVRHKEIHRAS